MANFTLGYFIDAGSDNAVLLEPTRNTSGADDVHCLGLCILQGQRDTIRPEVFVMAAKLGEGLKVALALAVLCSIQVALDHLNENTYSPMMGNEVEPPLVLASFEEGGRDHNPLIDAKAIVADPQDIASPREIEESIPSRYNPEVDYEPTPSVSKDNLDSPQDTWVVDEDVSDTNMAVSAHTLIGNESKDNVDDTATTRDLEIKSVNGDDPIVAVGVSSKNMLLKEGGGAGVDTSSLNMRLQKLFREAEAIRQVAAHPSYSSLARILKAEELMARITKELKDYDSNRSSLTRTKEKA
uniref:Uncharacterized protein n=1 Tax=Ananas comosus var. bracteatus TaxID=296719 RepID=A0A6V7NSF3_ANACO|nr:unnamed protein product [Ananas comosus var. bracteatus]